MNLAPRRLKWRFLPHTPQAVEYGDFSALLAKISYGRCAVREIELSFDSHLAQTLEREQSFAAECGHQGWQGPTLQERGAGSGIPDAKIENVT